MLAGSSKQLLSNYHQYLYCKCIVLTTQLPLYSIECAEGLRVLWLAASGLGGPCLFRSGSSVGTIGRQLTMLPSKGLSLRHPLVKASRQSPALRSGASRKVRKRVVLPQLIDSSGL